MNPLTNYAEVFNKNDSKLFAELFADDCIFYDTAPTCAGMDPMFVRGKEAHQQVAGGVGIVRGRVQINANDSRSRSTAMFWITSSATPVLRYPAAASCWKKKMAKLPGTMCVIAQSKHDNILLSKIERRILSKRAVSKVRRLNKHVK